MAPRKGTKKNKGSLVKDKEELELINKVKNQLKEDLDSQEKDIIKLRRACLFLEHYEEISPSSRLADDSEYKQNVKVVDNMLNEWKQDLKIGDTLETYLPEENCWYTGKVIESKENPKQHLIHFLKWDKKFDRWIDPNDYLIQPFGTLIFADEPKASTPAIEKPAVTPQKPSETVEVVEKTKTGRVIKKLVKANTPVSAPVSREKKSDSKSSQKKIQDDNDGDEDHNDWACTVCNMIETMDNDILVLCDGPCLRSFHHGCLDAAVRPDKDKVQEIRWLCNDCLQGSHLCFLCGERGEDYLDLFKCSLKMCGKYYHVNCLLQEGSSFIPPHVTYKEEIIQGDAAKQIIKKYQKRKEDPSQSFEKSRPAAVRKTSNGRGNSRKKKATKQEEESEEQEEMDVVNDDLQVEGEKDNEVKESIIITGDDSVIIRDVPNFHCSAHYCDTCSESYNKSLKVTTSLEACVYCPRAFHMNCIPPGARFNNFCLVCPLHPNRLLPGRARDDLKKVLFNLDIKQENNGDPSSVNEGSNMIDDHNLSIIPVFYDQLHIPEDFPDAGDLEGSHYRLPYYIKEEVENTPLTFKLINKNNYELITAEKMPPLTIPEYGCECKDICNYACLNAMMHIECCEMKSLSREGPLCSVGKHCTNRKLQNREYVKSIIFQEENMGLGLKSVDKVRKGTLIIEYIGEVIDEDEMIRRLNEQNILRPHDKDYYVMQLTNDLYVDGKFQGNFSRFINHSCDPNCELQRWNVRGHTRIAIVAIKDIEAGEPFSYDYQFETQQEEAFKCYCKTSKCRGTMAPNSSERLLKLAKSGRNEELRSKLIELGKIREKEANSYNVLKEKELQRCYTSSLLPGDSSHLMKNGPLKNTFRFARMNKLLLVRNLMKSTSLLKRCQVYLNENDSSVTASTSNNAAVSSVKEGNGRQSSRRSERKTVSSTSANTNSDSKSTNTPGRRGRKRKSDTKKDDDDDDEDYIMEVVELDS